MPTEIGEYVVGAYLKEVEGCDLIDYNVRPAEGGLKGLAELDVLGLRFKDGTAFLCEVATHLNGLQYAGGYAGSTERIFQKIRRAQQFARDSLSLFPHQHFSFWSPRVPKGQLTDLLAQIPDVEIIINEEYSSRVAKLKQLAAKSTRVTGNPFFRSLQLLEHLR